MVHSDGIRRGEGRRVIEVVMDVQLPGVDPAHPAFQGAVGELLADLRTVPALRARERDVPAERGSKGPLTELALSVSASGGMAALVRIVRIWLDRDRKRSLKVTVTTTKKTKTYDISGDGVSVETLKQALNAAIRTPDEKTDSGA
jgi:hypothetical protein